MVDTARDDATTPGGTVAEAAAGERILEVDGLQTYFFTREGIVKAVDDVSIHLDKGETLGVVGESGCGKSISALSIMRLVPDPPGKIIAGSVVLDAAAGRGRVRVERLQPHSGADEKFRRRRRHRRRHPGRGDAARRGGVHHGRR